MAQSPMFLGRLENTPGYNSYVLLLLLPESFDGNVLAFTRLLNTDQRIRLRVIISP